MTSPTLALPSRRPPPAVAASVGLIFIAVAAAALRLLMLHLVGGLRSVAEYDDGVHYGAAALLLHGVLPYRDVVFLQPPGITIVLAPEALLGRLTGDATGLYAARLATAVVGGVTTYLVGRLAQRHWGNKAGLVAAVVYATAAASLVAEATAMLEPYVALFTVLALHQLARVRQHPRAALVAGALLGVAISVKTWAVVTAVVALVWLLVTCRRAALPYAAGVAATAAAICGPFFLAAPTAMFHQVVVTQLSRPPDGLTAATARTADLLGVRTLLAGSPQTPITVATAALATTLVAAAYVAWRRGAFARLAVVLLAAGVAMLLAAPVYFTHYGDFLTPFAALVAGAAASAIATTGRAPTRLAPLAALLAVVTAIAGQQVLSATSRTAPRIASAASLRAIKSRPGCLMSETPTVAELADVFTRPHCPVWLDPRGTALSDGAGRLPQAFYPSGFRRLPRWQQSWATWATRSSEVALIGSPCAQPIWTPRVCHLIERRFRRVTTAGGSGSPPSVAVWARR